MPSGMSLANRAARAVMVLGIATGITAKETAPKRQAFTFRDWKVGDPLISGDPRLKQCVGITKGTACVFSDKQFAGEDVIQIGAAFSGKGLFAVEVRFGSNRADQIEAVLRARYGVPCATKTGEATNALGMKFPYRTSSWCFSDGKAIFRSIGAKLSEGDFEFASRDAALIGSDGKLPRPDF